MTGPMTQTALTLIADRIRLCAEVIGLSFALMVTASCDRQPDTQATVAKTAAAPAEIAPSAQWLTDITTQVGLDFTHQTGATGRFLLPEIMGAGGAMFDYDDDGDLDIYLINGGNDPLAAQPDGAIRNALYRQDPDLRFTNVTEHCGLGDSGYGMGVAIGDIDNDGDLDVFVTNFGPDQLFRNRGDGTFENITATAGVNINGWSASATFLDYDRDGWLDLYVTRYLNYDSAKSCHDETGRPDYCSPKVFAPQPHVLLRNNGDGTFADVSERAGIARAAGHGLGVVCDDANDDGWVDLYVGNDGDANFLWINQRDGTFVDQAVMMGVAFNMHGKAEAGMGVLAEDFDNDGRNELFVTHLRTESNRLYRRSSSAPVFDEVTGASGLTASGVRHTGFGTVALDLELDGDLDLVIANGGVTRGPLDKGAMMSAPWNAYAEHNQVFLNNGRGQFAQAVDQCHAFIDPVEVSRGAIKGDIDNDGDVDLLITNTQGPARLYRNDSPQAGHWLTVRAVDRRLKRDAIGARINVICGQRQFYRTVSGGSSYLSSSDLRAHFGIGSTTTIDRIDVIWPDGLHESFAGMPADQTVVLVRGQGWTPE